MAKKIPGQDWEEAPGGAPSDPRDLMDVFISGDVSLVIGHQNVGDKLAGADAAILQEFAGLIADALKDEVFMGQLGSVLQHIISARKKLKPK